jgi:hypothetical protein
MGFVLIEEWVDEDNPHKFYTMPVSAGTFATKEEAEEEKKQHQPQHVDGYIRVREECETIQPRSERKRAERNRHPVGNDSEKSKGWLWRVCIQAQGPHRLRWPW